MSNNPYENEPGYETAKKTEPKPAAYIAKIRHETLKIAVIQRLESLLQIPRDKYEPVSKKPKLHSSDSPMAADVSQSPGSSSSVESSSTPATEYEYDAEATFNAMVSHSSLPSTLAIEAGSCKSVVIDA